MKNRLLLLAATGLVWGSAGIAADALTIHQVSVGVQTQEINGGPHSPVSFRTVAVNTDPIELVFKKGGTDRTDGKQTANRRLQRAMSTRPPTKKK